MKKFKQTDEDLVCIIRAFTAEYSSSEDSLKYLCAYYSRQLEDDYFAFSLTNKEVLSLFFVYSFGESETDH